MFVEMIDSINSFLKLLQMIKVNQHKFSSDKLNHGESH